MFLNHNNYFKKKKYIFRFFFYPKLFRLVFINCRRFVVIETFSVPNFFPLCMFSLYALYFILEVEKNEINNKTYTVVSQPYIWYWLNHIYIYNLHCLSVKRLLYFRTQSCTKPNFIFSSHKVLKTYILIEQKKIKIRKRKDAFEICF